MKVTVIGAGVFGTWCAKFLADEGHDVTLVDAYGPANGRASSADHSRVIRAGYGLDDIYSRWAADAWRDWEWLAATSGQSVISRTGALFLGPPATTYISDTYATLKRLGLDAEWIEATEIERRYPQIDAQGLGAAVLERGAGVLRARRAVRALVDTLTTGAVTYLSSHVAPVDEQRATCIVRTNGQAVIEGDAFVFACGPWLPTLFPDAIGARVRPTRQEVLYFGVPAADPRFSIRQLPVWIDFAAGLYGIPEIDGHGFKVGIDRHGVLVDPDTLDRIVDRSVVAATREWLATRFPALADAPLVDAGVCQYENTSSGDFIIDRHPQWPHCWIVGGGSGHGFKHGPSVGRHVARLVNGEADVQPRFSLAAKTAAAARMVY
jgi:glycine/D-amino acid oxidase-like deaminating enzyme